MSSGVSISSGNAVVDEISSFSYAEHGVTYECIPYNWRKTLRRKSGKPYRIAIEILGDLTYWYHPAKVEESDGTTRYHPRFQGKYYSTSYQYYVDKFDLSRSSVAEALRYLEEVGVIKRHTKREKRVVDELELWSTTLYIELIPAVWKMLTLCETDTTPSSLNTQVLHNDDTVITILEEQTETDDIKQAANELDAIADNKAGFKADELLQNVQVSCEKLGCAPSELVEAFKVYMDTPSLWPSRDPNKRTHYALTWVKNTGLVFRCLKVLDNRRQAELKELQRKKELAMDPHDLANFATVRHIIDPFNKNDWIAWVHGELIVITDCETEKVAREKLVKLLENAARRRV